MLIAVCITNKETVCLLSQLLHLYQDQRDIRLSCRYYKNDMDLLSSFIPGKFDVLFYNETGSSSMIKEIEQRDNRIQFVCVAPVGRDTGIAGNEKDLRYRLPEPMDQLFLFSILDRLAAEIYKNDEAELVVKTRGSVMRLLFSQIECVEVTGRTLSFHLVGGRTQEISGTFSDYASRLLQWPDFFKVHRSFLVNLRHIEKLTADGVLTRSGRTVPVSRNLYAGLKQAYADGMRVMSASLPVYQNQVHHTDENIQPLYTILLVDDEETERLRWSKVLTGKGCIVLTADCSETALSLAREKNFDCVVLDVQLGNRSGFDLCEALSELTGAPVVYLSVLSDSENQMRGFVTGGVDYITKDTSNELFWAKVETRMKMTRTVTSQLCSGDLRLDLKLRKAFFQEQELLLTTVEFDILYLLIQNEGIVYEPTRLYELIWGVRQPDDGHTVSLHLSQLCRKLDRVSPDHSFIEISWGTGYRFVPKE